jgi:hypothetical protein
MTDDLIARLRHSDARYLADRCHIHAEAADALEAAENAIHTAQRQRDIWEKVAETQVARIAELEADLAAARGEKTDTNPPTLDRDLIPDDDAFMREWGMMCGPAVDFKAAGNAGSQWCEENAEVLRDAAELLDGAVCPTCKGKGGFQEPGCDFFGCPDCGGTGKKEMG